MRKFIALAVGLIMLVSAAAATGNENNINAQVYSEAVGNCVTGGVTVAQVTYTEADLIGNFNEAEQFQELSANDNCLTDSVDDDDVDSIFTQMGRQEAFANGSSNDICQDVWLNANDNCLPM
jgi:hypothetical protein